MYIFVAPEGEAYPETVGKPSPLQKCNIINFLNSCITDSVDNDNKEGNNTH